MSDSAVGAWVQFVPTPHNQYATIQKLDKPTALARGFSVSDRGVVRKNIIGSAKIRDFYMLHVYPNGNLVYGDREKIGIFLTGFGFDSVKIRSIFCDQDSESSPNGSIDTGLFSATYSVEGNIIYIKNITLVPRFVRYKVAVNESFAFTSIVGVKVSVRYDGTSVTSREGRWRPPHPHLDEGKFCIARGAFNNVYSLYSAGLYRSAVISVLDVISVHNVPGAYGHFAQRMNLSSCRVCGTYCKHGSRGRFKLPASGLECCPLCYRRFVTEYQKEEIDIGIVPAYIYVENGLDE